MTTASSEIRSRLAYLVSLCEGVLANVSTAPGATAVDEHALILAHQSLDQMRRVHGTPAAESLAVLVNVERRVTLMLELLGHAFARTDPVALFARTAIRDGYREIMRHARALGAQPAVAGFGTDEPALVIEPMITPVTFLHGDARMIGRHNPGAPTWLPFPIVFAPPYPSAAVGALSVLHHEVGHNLDFTFQLTEELRPSITAFAPEVDNVCSWPSWTREIVADALGTLLSSVGLGRELLKWREVYAGRDGGRSQTHPPLLVRGVLCWHWLNELGIATDCATMRDLARASDEYAESRAREADQVRELAQLVLTRPLTALNGAALRDLAPGLALDHNKAVAAARPDAPRATVADRLLPLVAALRIEAGTPPDVVAAEMLVDAIRRPTSAEPAREILFQANLRGAARSPILDEAAAGRKVPPPELLARARTAAFVGAVHDGLRTMLIDARALSSAPKESLEIFFLARDATAAMAPPLTAQNEYVRLGQEARAALDDALLDEVARDWIIYEFDHPYYFGSYFDVDQPGGRIHVSPHGWGMDIKYAPAIDYVWPPGQAHCDRTYRWYADALAGLRRQARVIRRRG